MKPNETSEYQPQKRCVIGIRGQIADPEYPVDIWFDSLKSVANVLSIENQQLLKVIQEQQPQSVTELAELTGRAVSNVSRTLKSMNLSGIIEFETAPDKKSKCMSLKYRNFLVLI